MSLFQTQVERQFLAGITTNLTPIYNKFFDYFGNPDIQANILEIDERQYQGEFIEALFVNILGYTAQPKPNFNLLREKKNETDAKSADGAISINNLIVAVIELKDHKTQDLKKVEVQAFGYKNNHKNCHYVVTSNFERLRFYIDNAVDFIEFDLFNLTFDEFRRLWMCLSYESIAKNLPQEIKNQSISSEDKVTKDLYKDYSAFKRLLFDNIVLLNPEYDKLLLFKKTQKLLDRFLFLFFAEDKELLPANSVKRTVEKWIKDNADPMNDYRSLYSRFVRYFKLLDEGYKDANLEIYAYNGGLFANDDLLNQIEVEDALLSENVLKIAEYNFSTEVDVNILGHIFENSLNEIEQVANEISTGVKTTSKRKQDGVFYTPRYITQYIVENTVGRLCEEKKTELGIGEELFDFKSAKKKDVDQKKKDALKVFDTYREWLLHITIVDPACGSGAFLNMALEFLIAEHNWIDQQQEKIAGLKGHYSMELSNIENTILENNLFGVDINDESVEIAKLSLWLRTAKPHRKLNSLNNNIKCGNSLIDDPTVAGEKAFDWHKEFPQIFAKGGFDVVIGNPPYGTISDKSYKEYFKHNYKSFQGNLENYCFFYEKFIELSKTEKGKVGLILPITWLKISQFENLRKVVLQFKISSIVALPTKVFSDADLDTLICILNKELFQERNEVQVVKVNTADNSSFENSLFTPNLIDQSIWLNGVTSKIEIDFDPVISGLINRINYNSLPLKLRFKVSQGIVPYAREELYKIMDKNEADNIVDNRLWHSNTKVDEFYKPELKGEDVSRYFIQWNGQQWVKYGKWLARPRTPEFFNSPRLLLREITRGNKLNASYIEEEYYNNPGIINVIPFNNPFDNNLLKLLLAIINSKLIFFYHYTTSPKAKLTTSIPKILISDVENLPLPKGMVINDNLSLIERVEFIISINVSLQQASNKFQRMLQRKFELEELPGKLQNWYLLSYKEFITELGKKKVKLTLSQESEWEDYFNSEKAKALEIKKQIDDTDREIDKMVYALYELTEEEVGIVEGE